MFAIYDAFFKNPIPTFVVSVKEMCRARRGHASAGKDVMKTLQEERKWLCYIHCYMKTMTFLHEMSLMQC